MLGGGLQNLTFNLPHLFLNECFCQSACKSPVNSQIWLCFGFWVLHIDFHLEIFFWKKFRNDKLFWQGVVSVKWQRDDIYLLVLILGSFNEFWCTSSGNWEKIEKKIDRSLVTWWLTMFKKCFICRTLEDNNC